VKVGFVGCGKWAQVLANAFQGNGHQIWGYVRSNGHGDPGLGKRASSRSELFEGIDAVVLAAPPEVVTDAAVEAIERGLPVLATKPIKGAEGLLELKLRAPFMVDFVHLHSPLWRRLCERIDTHHSAVRMVSVEFSGDGPVRPWCDGLDDYGSHAVAMALDIVGAKGLAIDEAKEEAAGDGKSLWRVTGRLEEIECAIVAGNGAAPGKGRRMLRVTYDNGDADTYEETVLNGSRRAELTTNRGYNLVENHNPLAALVVEFTGAVAVGNEEEWTLDLNLAADVEDAISKMRLAASEGP
jgi:predicted dehydrogenase